MTRSRKPSTEERRYFLKEVRRRINKTYAWLQKNNYEKGLRMFRSDLRRLTIKYFEVDE